MGSATSFSQMSACLMLMTLPCEPCVRALQSRPHQHVALRGQRYHAATACHQLSRAQCHRLSRPIRRPARASTSEAAVFAVHPDIAAAVKEEREDEKPDVALSAFDHLVFDPPAPKPAMQQTTILLRHAALLAAQQALSVQAAEHAVQPGDSSATAPPQAATAESPITVSERHMLLALLHLSPACLQLVVKHVAAMPADAPAAQAALQQRLAAAAELIEAGESTAQCSKGLGTGGVQLSEGALQALLLAQRRAGFEGGLASLPCLLYALLQLPAVDVEGSLWVTGALGVSIITADLMQELKDTLLIWPAAGSSSLFESSSSSAASTSYPEPALPSKPCYVDATLDSLLVAASAKEPAAAVEVLTATIVSLAQPGSGPSSGGPDDQAGGQLSQQWLEAAWAVIGRKLAKFIRAIDSRSNMFIKEEGNDQFLHFPLHSNPWDWDKTSRLLSDESDVTFGFSPGVVKLAVHNEGAAGQLLSKVSAAAYVSTTSLQHRGRSLQQVAQLTASFIDKHSTGSISTCSAQADALPVLRLCYFPAVVQLLPVWDALGVAVSPSHPETATFGGWIFCGNNLPSASLLADVLFAVLKQCSLPAPCSEFFSKRGLADLLRAVGTQLETGAVRPSTVLQLVDACRSLPEWLKTSNIHRGAAQLVAGAWVGMGVSADRYTTAQLVALLQSTATFHSSIWMLQFRAEGPGRASHQVWQRLCMRPAALQPDEAAAVLAALPTPLWLDSSTSTSTSSLSSQALSDCMLDRISSCIANIHTLQQLQLVRSVLPQWANAGFPPGVRLDEHPACWLDEELRYLNPLSSQQVARIQQLARQEIIAKEQQLQAEVEVMQQRVRNAAAVVCLNPIRLEAIVREVYAGEYGSATAVAAAAGQGGGVLSSAQRDDLAAAITWAKVFAGWSSSNDALGDQASDVASSSSSSKEETEDCITGVELERGIAKRTAAAFSKLGSQDFPALTAEQMQHLQAAVPCLLLYLEPEESLGVLGFFRQQALLQPQADLVATIQSPAAGKDPATATAPASASAAGSIATEAVVNKPMPATAAAAAAAAFSVPSEAEANKADPSAATDAVAVVLSQQASGTETSDAGDAIPSGSSNNSSDSTGSLRSSGSATAAAAAAAAVATCPTTQQLADIAQALGASQASIEPAVMDVLAAHVGSNLEHFSAQQLPLLLWAFARHPPSAAAAGVLEALVGAAAGHFGSWDGKVLRVAMWAAGQLVGQPAEPVAQVNEACVDSGDGSGAATSNDD